MDGAAPGELARRRPWRGGPGSCTGSACRRDRESRVPEALPDHCPVVSSLRPYMFATRRIFRACGCPIPPPTTFALILAPMAGVSEAPFRQICRRMGADVVLSRVPLLRGHPAPDPEHARGGGVRGVRAADRHPDLRRGRRWPPGGDGRGRADHGALQAGIHRHQLRLPGQEGGAAERRLGVPPGSAAGHRHHPRGRGRHAPAGHGEDPQRLERRAARPGRHRAPDAGRRCAGLHAARADPHPDVFRQGRLG